MRSLESRTRGQCGPAVHEEIEADGFGVFDIHDVSQTIPFSSFTKVSVGNCISNDACLILDRAGTLPGNEEAIAPTRYGSVKQSAELPCRRAESP